MGNVRRVFAEKKPDFAVAARSLKHEITHYLGITGVTDVRQLIRYDVENISAGVFEKAKVTVFSEPPVDDIYEETFDARGGTVFSVEYLPGQFDQRADSARQCVQLLNETEDPLIRTAVTYVISGHISEGELEAIKKHCINPVDSRETGMDKPETLEQEFEEPADIAICEGFVDMERQPLKELYDSLQLAMTFQDFLHIQNYFKTEEKRDPSMTEIRVLDTYWSDHCRHTTFSTELTDVTFEDGYYKKPMEETWQAYLSAFRNLYEGRSDKFICLMDLALMAMKQLKKEWKLTDQEESDEINACSIVVPVEIDGKTEEWLVNFKNETHNHPTEIEPFGGAATCLGGAIRDPLSGRTYVYQAMRVTGAADPTRPVSETLEGKLPQKNLTRGAARGYSSYGNQIGLATGYVKEIYHPDYVAKRMEIGAVLGAAPRAAVQRLTSDPGDLIVLLGGRTGRDGCGGATGSSKAHTTQSIDTCGAEVQKGNPPTERKIQRLFRRPEVSFMIKKCNDFGAGGVSVAIGELADGLRIELDRVPKKYAGLDGTEIAISESQERMACVIARKDVDAFLSYAGEENLEAVVAASVTEEPRLVLVWRGKEIVNISRAFLNTNGAHQKTKVAVEIPKKEESFFAGIQSEKVAGHLADNDIRAAWLDTLGDLNVCSQKGLVEMFDSSIGTGSVLMPYGGRYQLTETQSMVAKLPVASGNTDTVTMMSYGFDPYLSSWSPYHGAVYAVLESLSRIVACGGDFRHVRFTFQEYFRRMSGEPSRWSQPFAALLGAYAAQMGFGLPSIGGKDSMSGTFNEIDVPPTLVSFAVDIAKRQHIITPELKEAGSVLMWFDIEKDSYDLPVYGRVMKLYDTVHGLMRDGLIRSAYALDGKGLAAALGKMAFGNRLGVTIDTERVTAEQLFAPATGSLVVEVPAAQAAAVQNALDDGMARFCRVIGSVTSQPEFVYGGMVLTMEDALAAWTGTLEKVFPTVAVDDKKELPVDLFQTDQVYVCRHKTARPVVFIPVFPGTNCEDDSARAFERAGADVIVQVFKNLDGAGIRDSVAEFEAAINRSQILMFPGGFSAGDEPEGSAKFFANVFRNERLKEAVMRLLQQRDGLALGICNGFQALLKLGLLPYGEITDQKPESPTLTYNTIGRHVSKMATIRVVSNKSPWLAKAENGGIYVNPVSHGEGRFVASKEWLKQLTENGQVATRYVNEAGIPTMDETWNVNGSYLAIEGITSPDGRVYGKMGHAERTGRSVAVNIPGEQDLKLFEAGVEYFR